MPLLTLVYKLWKMTTTIEKSNHTTVEKKLQSGRQVMYDENENEYSA
jgi:hypothetical protein